MSCENSKNFTYAFCKRGALHHIISQIIGLPVLQQSANPYNEVVLPLSLNDLREFFQAVPQGEKCATSIWIGSLFSSHRMLAKIVQ
jgi:hypothetical protein